MSRKHKKKQKKKQLFCLGSYIDELFTNFLEQSDEPKNQKKSKKQVKRECVKPYVPKFEVCPTYTFEK